MGRQLLRWSLVSVVVCGGILALSGQWTSPLLWGYLAGISALVLYALMSIEPELGDERFHPPEPGADAPWLLWVRLSALAAVIVAPLDGGRFHWSPPLPDGVRAAALAGSLGAFALCFRAMITNRFFSSVIRIQHDRGHRVVEQGPYAIVRHPGYLGMIAGVPLMALGLGSWWGFLLASVYSLLILRRVAYEDRFLQQHLPGYRDYTARVTARLLPGLW